MKEFIDTSPAALRALAASHWQPIETAPKDGTHVILWDGEGPSFTGCFAEGHGWLTSHAGFSVKPTHWMPLPEGPKTKTRSQKLRDAGYAARDIRLECDECDKKCTPQMLPIHKCLSEEPKAPEIKPPTAYVPDFDGSWLPVTDAPPGQELILKLYDGSELHGCLLQSDGDFWWGRVLGDRFIDPGFCVGWKTLPKGPKP